jgi:hypothetical protein
MIETPIAECPFTVDRGGTRDLVVEDIVPSLELVTFCPKIEWDGGFRGHHFLREAEV